MPRGRAGVRWKLRADRCPARAIDRGHGRTRSMFAGTAPLDGVQANRHSGGRRSAKLQSIASAAQDYAIGQTRDLLRGAVGIVHVAGMDGGCRVDVCRGADHLLQSVYRGGSARWAWQLLLVSGFAGLNALGIGMLGHYLLRIYDHVRGRPLYLVDRTVNCAAADISAAERYNDAAATRPARSIWSSSIRWKSTTIGTTPISIFSIKRRDCWNWAPWPDRRPTIWPTANAAHRPRLKRFPS